MLSCRIPADLFRKVEVDSAREGVSISHYVRVRLEETTADIEIPKPAEVVAEIPEPADVPRDNPQPEVETPGTRCKTPNGVHPSSRRTGEFCNVCRQHVGSAI